jgi:hypothetical protein
MDVVGANNAYHSKPAQIVGGAFDPISPTTFVLYDNNLSGQYGVLGRNTLVGFVSSSISDSTGAFATPVVLDTTFAPKLMQSLEIAGDLGRQIALVDFDITITNADNQTFTQQVRGNTDVDLTVALQLLLDVNRATLIIYKISAPGFPAVVMKLSIASTITYDETRLMSMDLLEELSYEDSIASLGSLSANEITVVLDNSNDDFYIGNTGSPISRQLKKNRRIMPWLGIEDETGTVVWSALGTFWAYRWTVPVDSLTATVVGFDTIGMLGTAQYNKHPVYANIALSTILTDILVDAQETLPSLQFDIDASLSNISVPYVWFKRASHRDALAKVASSGLVDIYCDRFGGIMCRPTASRGATVVDTWSTATNIIGRTFPDLNTDTYNRIEVSVNQITLTPNVAVYELKAPRQVTAGDTMEVVFTKPTLNGAVILATTSTGAVVDVTMEQYSWGALLTFNATANVTTMTITGTTIDSEYAEVVAIEDTESIYEDGVNIAKIESELIQTAARARQVATELLAEADGAPYTLDVQYRGDISLTLGDGIQLVDKYAPTTPYYIYRHNLNFMGGLTGSATLKLRRQA